MPLDEPRDGEAAGATTYAHDMAMISEGSTLSTRVFHIVKLPAKHGLCAYHGYLQSEGVRGRLLATVLRREATELQNEVRSLIKVGRSCDGCVQASANRACCPSMPWSKQLQRLRILIHIIMIIINVQKHHADLKFNNEPLLLWLQMSWSLDFNMPEEDFSVDAFCRLPWAGPVEHEMVSWFKVRRAMIVLLHPYLP